MSEDFEKNKNETGGAAPESSEELEAAIEEAEDELGVQLEELDVNMNDIDFQAFMERDFGRTKAAFDQAKEDITAAAQGVLAGSAGLIALGTMNMAATGAGYEQVQGFFNGGLAAGGVAAAVYVIGHAMNKMKGWSSRASS